MAEAFRTSRIDRFHVLEAGEGPLVLCLHGFPDHPRTFRHQLPALAAAGLHAVAPFMRGYGPEGPPADGRYDGAALAADAIALMDALGTKDAVLFGHDWGAFASYMTALMAPDRVRRLVTAALPYGPRFITALAEDYAQQRRSWYMMFFQHALGEEAVARDDFAFLEHLWRDWSPGWQCPPEEMDALKETFRRPGVLSAALAYYRQGMGPVLGDPSQVAAAAQAMTMPIAAPGLMLHGADDGCIGAEHAEGAGSYFPRGLRIEIVLGAGHFVHLEKPDRVNALVTEFLRS